MRNLCKNIGGQMILHDISLDIYEGEIFGLIGANGAGKTTLMKILAGLTKEDGGHMNCYVLEKDKVGVLLEFPAAYDWLSGYRNLEVLAGMYKDVTKDDLFQMIKLVGLERDINKKYLTFSIGMKQRLGIAAALLNRPKLLILDEPTNGLDFQGICEMRALLERLVEEENCTIILSSHMLCEMEKVCNRVAFIKKGKMVDVMDGDMIRLKGLETRYRELIGVG